MTKQPRKIAIAINETGIADDAAKIVCIKFRIKNNNRKQIAITAAAAFPSTILSCLAALLCKAPNFSLRPPLTPFVFSGWLGLQLKLEIQCRYAHCHTWFIRSYLSSFSFLSKSKFLGMYGKFAK